MNPPADTGVLHEDAESQDPMQTPSLIDERVHARTCELAAIAGRAGSGAVQGDYEQAKRELAEEGP